jgi:predicted extracellular nuclease
LEAQNNNNEITIGFYNLENLFDIYDDPYFNDDDYLPEGEKKWSRRRYKKKIKRLSKVIRTIGDDTNKEPPVILGVAEVENIDVVLDLIETDSLKDFNYGVVHFDSQDERGIEVALLYRREYFELIESKRYSTNFLRHNGSKDFTRDILKVKGKLNGELMYFLVNHWPSRRKGTKETEHRRVHLANLARSIINEIQKQDSDAKIIVMGDFNDNPIDKSIKQVLVTDDFFNPMEFIFEKGNGSGNHQGEWFLFDQIIFTNNFYDRGMYRYKNAAIYDKHFLRDKESKHKENPLRTYKGRWYKGGMSDHFPVYITIEQKENE